jgi:hypothetical protein
MSTAPLAISLSRGPRLWWYGPESYAKLLTGLAEAIMAELAELERVDWREFEPEAMEQVVGITQIRLLNELYYCLGQLRSHGVFLEVKQAIQDLRDIWNRLMEATGRPEILKFHEEPNPNPLQ